MSSQQQSVQMNVGDFEEAKTHTDFAQRLIAYITGFENPYIFRQPRDVSAPSRISNGHRDLIGETWTSWSKENQENISEEVRSSWFGGEGWEEISEGVKVCPWATFLRKVNTSACKSLEKFLTTVDGHSISAWKYNALLFLSALQEGVAVNGWSQSLSSWVRNGKGLQLVSSEDPAEKQVSEGDLVEILEIPEDEDPTASQDPSKDAPEQPSELCPEASNDGLHGVFSGRESGD
ncbi:hypothetical protein DB88DRAFT_545593 [Papiliotrema laurentii]|uniref:Uncharacterized protein n=1 Tax=Papiliotrema laurentii TaxID=5418 RepID=A0AAD9FR22_PAPLA|nr:hypothetical protein DB88DRAFT_545593 [Papiliotrema laurentii]